jgi:hypothetical protein
VGLIEGFQVRRGAKEGINPKLGFMILATTAETAKVGQLIMALRECRVIVMCN